MVHHQPWVCIVCFLCNFPLEASQLMYDFGHFGEPETIFENPVGLSRCNSQVSISLKNTNTEFYTESDFQDYEIEQLSTKGLLNLGGCIELTEQLTTGFSVNVNALTFNFESEQQSKRKLFPYTYNSSPLASFGAAIRVTERITFGSALQIIGKVDLFADENLEINESFSDSAFVTSLDVVVRPKHFFSIGLAYHLNDFFDFEEVIIYGGWTDKQDSDFTLDIDLGLINNATNLNIPIELDALSVVGQLESIPEKIRIGIYAVYNEFSIDFSITNEKWSDLQDPFFRLSLPLAILEPINAVVFPEVQNIRFENTYNLNLFIKYNLDYALAVFGGYGYRGDAVASEGENAALLGEAMHILKGGLSFSSLIGKYIMEFSGHLNLGRLSGSNFGDGEVLRGNYTLFEGAVRILF